MDDGRLLAFLAIGAVAGIGAAQSSPRRAVVVAGSSVRVGPRLRAAQATRQEVFLGQSSSTGAVWRAIVDSAEHHGRYHDSQQRDERMRVGDLELGLGLAIDELDTEPKMRWFLDRVAEGRIPNDVPRHWTPRSIHDAASVLVKRSGWWASQPVAGRRALIEKLTAGAVEIGPLETVLAWALDVLKPAARGQVLERYVREVGLWDTEGPVNGTGSGNRGSAVRVGPRLRAAAEVEPAEGTLAVVLGLVPPDPRSSSTSWVPVRVEVDLLKRLPRTVIVGLPAVEAADTIERVRAAIDRAGFEFPRARVVVNVAPADIRKPGGWTDLPIAVGILMASGQLPRVAGVTFVGRFAGVEEGLGLDFISFPSKPIVTDTTQHGRIVTHPGAVFTREEGWHWQRHYMMYLSHVKALFRGLEQP